MHNWKHKLLFLWFYIKYFCLTAGDWATKGKTTDGRGYCVSSKRQQCCAVLWLQALFQALRGNISFTPQHNPRLWLTWASPILLLKFPSLPPGTDHAQADDRIGNLAEDWVLSTPNTIWMFVPFPPHSFLCGVGNYHLHFVAKEPVVNKSKYTGK